MAKHILLDEALGGTWDWEKEEILIQTDAWIEQFSYSVLQLLNSFRNITLNVIEMIWLSSTFLSF